MNLSITWYFKMIPGIQMKFVTAPRSRRVLPNNSFELYETENLKNATLWNELSTKNLIKYNFVCELNYTFFFYFICLHA